MKKSINGVEKMLNLKKSKFFKEYKDPESGVVSYVLDVPSIPHSQSFYFTNPSATDDGRYIWVYVAFPPAGNALFGRSLAVIDTKLDTFHHYPETMFHDASPIVDTNSGEIYFTNGSGLWKKSPDPSEKAVQIAPIPDFLKGCGHILKLATHMTFSPDRKKLCYDAIVGNKFYFGEIDLERGEFMPPWYVFDKIRNHAQFNPVKPDVMLIAEDEGASIDAGVFTPIGRDENGKLTRMFILEKGREPIYVPPLFIEARHEWWSGDGESIFYVDWDNGTVKYNIPSGEYTVINPRGTWHSHATADEKYFVADENEIDGLKWYRGCKSRVHFYNAETKKHVNIVSENPALYTRENQCTYHIDPHPQFTMNESAVMYTATVFGKVSAAICEVSELVEKTK